MGDFREPRDVIGLPRPVLEVFASRPHRLLHAVWHGVRDSWRSSSLDRPDDLARKAINDLGWSPPRHALDWVQNQPKPAVSNGSGEDFLFMHRQMIAVFDAAMKNASGDPDIGWVSVPQPGVPGTSGYAVPPSWEIQGIPTLQRRFESLKSDIYFWSRMRWWDREFKNPYTLSRMTLGEMGSLLETSIHNDMHIRWSSQPRDPRTGDTLLTGRADFDLDSKWDDPVYDFLGETYSSHVNPVFWRLHKWVDARIDDWAAAHQALHSNELVTATVGGVEWFQVGKWVKAGDPWSGPAHTGHDHHGGAGDDVARMEKVMRLLFPPPGSVAPSIGRAAPGEVLPGLRNLF
jgi:hypothetical protein